MSVPLKQQRFLIVTELFRPSLALHRFPPVLAIEIRQAGRGRPAALKV